MEPERLADDVLLLPSRPSYSFNSYVVGDVLLDAGIRRSEGRLRRLLAGRELSAHAVTHAHADHQGASAALCAERGIPFWGPEAERAALESGDLLAMGADNVITRWQCRHWAGPGLHVDRGLREGDALAAGFVAVEAPGHSPGLLAFWRESDRLLIAADALFGRSLVLGRPGLHEPPAIFTLDPRAACASIRHLAALRPAVVAFGHGPPLRDGDALQRFAEALPR